jgi:GTP-binding protein
MNDIDKIKIFSGSCDFVIGAMSIDAIPPTNLPEVAFIGRSNVGKSSLINALTNRNSLARVSQTPGCTRQINFFNLGEKLYLVDMPGYGYAKRDKQEKAQWKDLIYYYLTGRQQLKRAYVLIDARHPLKKDDVTTMKYLDDYAISYQLVLTKADKTSKKELQENIEALKEAIKPHPACHPEVLVTSSDDKTGIDTLRIEIMNFRK